MSESKWTNIDAKRGPKKSIWIGESKERDDIYPGKDGKPVPSRYGPDRVYVANFLASGKVTEEQAAANASRAVACVNACTGLADPAAELTRLRAVEEAADTMREWAREHLKPPTHQANLSHNRQRFLDSLAAYDAARNPTNAKGDAHAGE